MVSASASASASARAPLLLGLCVLAAAGYASAAHADRASGATRGTQGQRWVTNLNGGGAGAPVNPSLCYLLFYTCLTPEVDNQCDEGYTLDQAGIVNLGFTNSTTLAVAGRKVNISSLFAVHGVFFENGVGMRPGWEARWEAAKARVLPLIEAGTIIGFFLGDELISGKDISVENVTTAANAVGTLKATYPHLFSWLNEGGTGWVKKLGASPLPHNVDVISIDDYSLTVDQHRAFYTSTLYPKLSGRQRTFVVPGSYGSHVNPHETMQQYEVQMVARAKAFYAWAANDPMVVGFAPWHWDTRSPKVVSFGKEVGTVDMPQLKAEWHTIGTSIRATCTQPY